jgi:hypothetical protein
MANSLDEFDANVSRSMEDYGEALRAAAKQQSTFQAKFDIMQNSFKNAFAPEFDPNQDFRTSMKESIGLMDNFNALFSSDNAEATMARMIALFPQIGDEFKAIKDTMASGTSDRDIFWVMMDNLKASKEEAKGNVAELKLIGDEMQSIAGIIGSLKVFGDKTNNFSDALLSMNDDAVTNKAQKLAIRFSKELKNAIEKTQSYNDTTESNKFIDTIFGTDAEYKAGLDRIKELGRITKQQYDFLLKERGGQMQNLYRSEFQNNGNDISKGSEKTLVNVLKQQYLDRIQVLKDINKGSLEFNEKSLASNKRQIQRSIDDMNATSDELCEKFPTAAAAMGIVCEKKGRNKTERVERFQRDSELDSQYGIDKNKLEIQYRNEDDPIAKAGINDDLINLEITYRDKLNDLYEAYLKKQESTRAAYIARNPSQKDAFDRNMETVSGSQTKDAATGTKNQDKYDLRDVSAKQSRYEAEFNEKQKYALKMAVLDNKLKGLDRSDAKGRKAIMDEMNKNTKAYYKGELKDLNKFFDDLEKEIADLEAENVLLIADGQSAIDISSKTKLFGKKEGTLNKSRTDEQKALKTGNRKDNEDFDYLGASIGAFDEVTGLITQAGNARLEVMQQQADAELAIIQGRHDTELGILDSALNAGIISQDDAAAAKDRADKRKIQKENKVAKKMFDAQKKIDMQTAIFTGISSTAQAVAQAFANSPNPAAAAIFAGISTAAIAASTAMNIKGVSQRKFVPKKFADGGMVHGASHAQGGVPFTVRGNGGYEMEGGEFIVNREAAKNNLAELERINGKTRTGKRKFATGGVISESSESVNGGINEALLEALTKPVRAFVTSQDLEKSQSERDALSRKTSY